MLSFAFYSISGGSITSKASSSTTFHLDKRSVIKVSLSIVFRRIIGKAYPVAIFHLAVE